MIFNYSSPFPCILIAFSSFACPALSEQTFNLLTGPTVKAFLITKVPQPLSLPWPGYPASCPPPPISQLVSQSMTSLIWHLLDLPSLFIHPSCPTVLLSHCSLSLLHTLVLSHSNCRICFKLYQSPFSPFANQINSHSQSNRNPSKAMESVIYDAISKVQGRPCWAPTLPSTLPCPALLCGCACCVGSALGCTLLISWPHIARHS